MGSALIVNPQASRVTPELTVAVERELAVAGELDTLLTEGPRHAADLAAAASKSYERLYVFGGDGAFNEVVNGRRFTFSAGLGLDAELVRRVDDLGRENGRRAGDLAFARTLGGLLARRGGRLQPAMTVLGRERVAFAMVANCDPYTFAGPLALHIAPRARFERGLDLIAPRAVAPWQLPRLAAWALTGRGQATSRHALYLHDVDLVEIECDVPLPLQADGEDLGDVDAARFEAERDALTVVVGDT